MIIALSFLAISCGNSERVDSTAYHLMLQGLLEHSTSQISVDSLAQIKDQVVLLDARSREEYEVSRIPGARYVGYSDINKPSFESLPRDTSVVVYCSVGYRSEKVVQKLEKEGFSNISNVYGGIFEWVNQGHPLESESGRTERIHGYNKTWGFWLESGEVVY